MTANCNGIGMAELEHVIQESVKKHVAPLQSELTQLQAKNDNLENELKRREEQIKTLVEASMHDEMENFRRDQKQLQQQQGQPVVVDAKKHEDLNEESKNTTCVLKQQSSKLAGSCTNDMKIEGKSVKKASLKTRVFGKVKNLVKSGKKALADFVQECENSTSTTSTRQLEGHEIIEDGQHIHIDNAVCISGNEWGHCGACLVQSDKRRVFYEDGQRDYYSATVRAAHPFSLPTTECSLQRRMCYFEVKIVKPDFGKPGYYFKGEIWIGLCTSEFSLNEEAIGHGKNSFAISSYGSFYIDDRYEARYGDGMHFGDVIGCGIEEKIEEEQKNEDEQKEAVKKGKQEEKAVLAASSESKCTDAGGDSNNGKMVPQRWLFFTKNGKFIGNPSLLPVETQHLPLFPAVTLNKCGTGIEANFGQERFKYDLSKHELAPMKK